MCDTPFSRAGLLNPFLGRFLTSAGVAAAGYGGWRSGQYLCSALRGDGRFYPNPGLKPDEYYPYDNREMRTICETARWVVPFFLSLDEQEAVKPGRYDPPPGRHGWPYHW
jgi:hypothetical protein